MSGIRNKRTLSVTINVYISNS